jgi:hypothetical protein
MKRWLTGWPGSEPGMGDQRERETPDDREPRAGAGASGSGLSASDKAQNAETVLDPDREPEDPADELVDQIEQLERHSRPPAQQESPPSPDTPSA